MQLLKWQQNVLKDEALIVPVVSERRTGKTTLSSVITQGDYKCLTIFFNSKSEKSIVPLFVDENGQNIFTYTSNSNVINEKNYNESAFQEWFGGFETIIIDETISMTYDFFLKVLNYCRRNKIKLYIFHTYQPHYYQSSEEIQKITSYILDHFSNVHIVGEANVF